MSIATSIAALQTAKSDISNAIIARGGTVNTGDGMSDFATDILSISPSSPGQNTGSAADNIKASRPSTWPNYSYIDLTGQEVCYLTYDYVDRPNSMVRYLSINVSCTGNYTIERGKVSASGFAVDATYTAAGGSSITLIGEDTGTEDVVCYRITGTTITSISYNAYTDASGTTYISSIQPAREVYARLPNLTSVSGLASRTTKYETLRDVSAVTSLQSAWNYCYSLQALDLSGWNVSAVTSLQSAWNACYALQALDLSGWNVSAVTSLASAWYNCHALQALDLSGWNVSAVTDLGSTWYNCHALQALDLSGWNVSGVTTLAYTWYNCASLQSLDLSGWNVSAVTSLSNAWNYCYSLQALDLSGWNVSAVTSLQSAWNACSALFYLGAPTNIKVSLSLSSSPGYNVATLVSVIAALYDLTGNTAQTLTLGSTNKAKLTAEQIAVATAKNWTIA